LQTGNEALEQLRHRFALRLDTALDALGYPGPKTARIRALAAALGMDLPLVTAMVSGLHLPDLEQLLPLCALLRRQPGYFLDECVRDLPPGTRVVRPLDIGEDLVLRLPSDVLSASEAQKDLRYWRATVPMGFGIAAGELLIVLTVEPHAAVEPRKLYLYSSRQSIDVIQCVEAHEDRAMFRTGAGVSNAVPLIVPTGKRGQHAGQLSKLVASIRHGGSLHPRG
jgi:hypothetical protein